MVVVVAHAEDPVAVLECDAEDAGLEPIGFRRPVDADACAHPHGRVAGRRSVSHLLLRLLLLLLLFGRGEVGGRGRRRSEPSSPAPLLRWTTRRRVWLVVSILRRHSLDLRLLARANAVHAEGDVPERVVEQARVELGANGFLEEG